MIQIDFCQLTNIEHSHSLKLFHAMLILGFNLLMIGFNAASTFSSFLILRNVSVFFSSYVLERPVAVIAILQMEGEYWGSGRL